MPRHREVIIAADSALRLPSCAPARIVVLASGTGSLFEALLAASVAADYPARIIRLVVDRPCRAAEVAEAAGVEVTTVVFADYPDRADWDADLAAAIDAAEPDLVVAAGFMRILRGDVLRRPIVNAHPALLPSFPGAHAVRDALAHGVRVTGSTIHLVDGGVDTGPILAQRAVPILPGDSESTLHERIKQTERELLAETIADVVTHGVVIDGRKAHRP